MLVKKSKNAVHLYFYLKIDIFLGRNYPALEQTTVIAHAHRTGQGQGLVLGSGTMDFCITLCSVHTTKGQGQETIVTARKRSLGQGNISEACVKNSVGGGVVSQHALLVT